MLPLKLPWEKAQTIWKSQLDPLIKNPTAAGIILQAVRLTTGANIINHTLGRKLQGWSITRIRSAATVYDTQDSNNTPEQTLNLTASANVVVDLLVF